ncbi:ubiquinone biosynthesis O-methyltransferase-like [Colias croceus]|uniref:ubiquinone biosynthesis O-methyltransferase-like n=1 Tax=Colias crocea TaxID=72248 RepID=UPI001E281947|nr:ubiquinone biosynthesis O-methyltransferase-like [Colias croceus]XP_045498793.1 ubiquinone biosynthesis O-methyltransferase-like [Colias croceus]XP_045498794.1 ubiquinone biosynthesis O-methyltransferase-like [Colias croceus]
MNVTSLRPSTWVTKCLLNNGLLKNNLKRSMSLSMNMSKSDKPKSTVDEGDVQRHTNLLKDWWDPNGSIKALHSFNLLRVPFVRDGLVSESERGKTLTPLANKTILDIGCGGGILSEGLARIGANVTGVDASNDLIELAKQHSTIDPKIAGNKPTYLCTTIEEHSKEFTDHYDAVVASEVIEHVADKELFVKSCVEAVKPGGKIFITTPNRSRLTQVLGIFVAEYILNAIPKGTHQYDKFTTPNEVTFLLERNNCHVEIVQGVTYNPFTNKWTWIDSQTLCFALQACKLDPNVKSTLS